MAVVNQEDDWLSLDSPPQQPVPAANPRAPKPNLAPHPTQPSSTTRKSVETPRPKADELDELQLAPLEPSNSAPASPAAKPTTRLASDSTAKRSVFDDDLPDLVPLDSLPSPPPPSGLSPTDLPPLAPLTPNTADRTKSKNKPSSKPSRPMVGSLEELSLSTPALGDEFAIPSEEEFRFPCKVCGTFLYASQSRIGKQIRCPDCFSQFSIPSPPVKKKQPAIQLEEGPGVTFAPIDADNVRSQSGNKQKTDEILDRAAEEVERERDDIDQSGSFDSKRWIGLIFGHFKDKWVVAATCFLGLITGIWFYAIADIGTILNLGTNASWILSIGLFLVLCIPILGSVCMCGLGILTMAANRAPKVLEWPFFRLGESIGECLMVLISMMAASIPGGMIGAVTNTIDAHPMLTIGFIMLSVWGVTPILLMCMIDNSSIFEPFSKAVIDSMKSFSDAWGAMYMQSAIAFLCFWTLLAIGFVTPVAVAICGAFFPFLAFFVFNQYGVLAGRISGATQMGFDGDFSDD